jgi:multiple sugar transport system substrate-binding protein
MPVPDDHQGPIYTYGDPKNIVIFNTCQFPEQAWEFLKYMLSKENELLFLEMTNQLPRRRNIFSDETFQGYFTKNPKMIPFAKQAKYVRGTDVSAVLKEVFDVISQEYEACVIYGIKDAESAIKDAANAVRVLLK